MIINVEYLCCIIKKVSKWIKFSFENKTFIGIIEYLYIICIWGAMIIEGLVKNCLI